MPPTTFITGEDGSTTTTPNDTWVCSDVDPVIDLGGYAIEGYQEEVTALVSQCIPDLASSTYDDQAMARAGQYGHLGIVEAMLALGADPTYVDEQGTSVLVWASMGIGGQETDGSVLPAPDLDASKAAVVARLIAEGALVDYQGATGDTALLAACIGGFEQVAAVLIDAGADPNLAKPADGLTPLIAAAAHNLVQVVESLLASGADPTARTSDGQTAMDLAEAYGFDEVVSLLARSS